MLILNFNFGMKNANFDLKVYCHFLIFFDRTLNIVYLDHNKHRWVGVGEIQQKNKANRCQPNPHNEASYYILASCRILVPFRPRMYLDFSKVRSKSFLCV